MKRSSTQTVETVGDLQRILNSVTSDCRLEHPVEVGYCQTEQGEGIMSVVSKEPLPQTRSQKRAKKTAQQFGLDRK